MKKEYFLFSSLVEVVLGTIHSFFYSPFLCTPLLPLYYYLSSGERSLKYPVVCMFLSQKRVFYKGKKRAHVNALMICIFKDLNTFGLHEWLLRT